MKKVERQNGSAVHRDVADRPGGALTSDRGSLGAAGELLRRHRLRAGLTQDELAARAGLGARTLRDIESGRVRAPRERSVAALAAALALSDPERHELRTMLGAVDDDRVVRIGVLGPLSVSRAGLTIDAGPPMRRALLGLLALRLGAAVPREEIIDVLWGERPPKTCATLVHVHIGGLRDLLEPQRVPRSMGRAIVLAGGGYLLDEESVRVDLAQFDQLTARAHQEIDLNDPAGAFDLFREALKWWRGPVLADAGARLRQHPDAVAAARRRETAAMSYADVAFELGRPGPAAAMLRGLVCEEPLHEGLHARLMLALAGSGEHAAALRLYADVRDRLRHELGTEPGPELRATHVRVLRGEIPTTEATPVDDTIQVAGRPDRPAQLPADPVTFVGRREQLHRLDALLASRAAGRANVAVISGTAGVGKTALAVHWAHRIRDRFPDGQLYVGLHGFARARPTQPIEALAHLLRAFGVSAKWVPADVEEAAALYRSLLADRRVLVLLDNASTPEQVRPLLPGSPGCLVLVTSRNRMSGLTARDGARRLFLDVLSPDEAGALIARMLGPDRVAAEPAAAAELARACAHLPLALCIAAAHLADHPDRGIAEQVAELGRDRLSTLELDDDPDSAVRAAFDLSYQTLDRVARRLFRLLGLVPGPDFCCDAAGALAGYPPQRCAQVLDRLAAAHLVSRPAPGRYGLHDLLRQYAAGRARREDGSRQCAAAVNRLLDWYLHAADAAASLLYPHMLRLEIRALGRAVPLAGFRDDTAALAWLTVERAGLLAAVRHAARHGPCSAAWLLADTLRGYFWRSRNTVDWLAATRAGMSAAVAEGELTAQAALHLSLAMAHQCIGQPDAVIEHYTAAADLARQVGWADARAASVGNLGIVHAEIGNLQESAECQRQALQLYRQTGRRVGEANTLCNLGVVYRELGELNRSADHYIEALALFQQTGSRDAEATALDNLAHVKLELGRLEQARAHCTRAVALHRQTGNRYGEAEALRTLAAIQLDAGRPAEALDTGLTALNLARDIDERRIEADIHNTLGAVYASLGQLPQATDHHRKALRLAADVNAQHPETEALLGLAVVCTEENQHAAATEHAQQALALTRRVGYRLLQARALTTLAAIELATCQHDQATDHARQALVIHQQTGHLLGEGRTFVVLGHTCLDRADAAALWTQALGIFTTVGAAPDAARVRALLGQ